MISWLVTLLVAWLVLSVVVGLGLARAISLSSRSSGVMLAGPLAHSGSVRTAGGLTSAA